MTGYTFIMLGCDWAVKLSPKSLIKETYSLLNKGGNFLKKLWCCIGKRVYQGNLVLSTELIT